MSIQTEWITERMPLDLLGPGTPWGALCLDAVCRKLCTWAQNEHLVSQDGERMLLDLPRLSKRSAHSSGRTQHGLKQEQLTV